MPFTLGGCSTGLRPTPTRFYRETGALELKADAEHADARLDILDKRVGSFTSARALREVVRKVTPKVVNVANFRAPKEAELALLAKKGLIFDAENDHKYVQIGVPAPAQVIQAGRHLDELSAIIMGTQQPRISFRQPCTVDRHRSPKAVVGDAITRFGRHSLAGRICRRRSSEECAAGLCRVRRPWRPKPIPSRRWALAVQQPHGLKQTVYAGVINAEALLGMLDLVELLQTDAAINPTTAAVRCSIRWAGRSSRRIGIAIANDNGAASSVSPSPRAPPRRSPTNYYERGELPRGYLGIAHGRAGRPASKSPRKHRRRRHPRQRRVGRRKAAGITQGKPGDMSSVQQGRPQPLATDPPLPPTCRRSRGTRSALEIVHGDERRQMPAHRRQTAV